MASTSSVGRGWEEAGCDIGVCLLQMFVPERGVACKRGFGNGR